MVQWLTPLLSFAAVFIAAWLVRLNESEKRKLEFIDKQLHELYSPVLGLLKEIRALSELRVRIQQVAGETWRELASRGEVKEADYDPYRALITYENEQMRDYLLPRYHKTHEMLHANYYLATETTRQHLSLLVEYVELWTRNFAKNIPGPVLVKLDVTEAKLRPLYDDLETTFNNLRATLAAGATTSLWNEIVAMSGRLTHRILQRGTEH